MNDSPFTEAITAQETAREGWMADPAKTQTRCCTCGFSWETGKNGSHSCTDKLIGAIGERDYEIDQLGDQLNAKDNEIYLLKQWKESAMAVESEWDDQSVAKILGLTLGGSIRKQIEPKIVEMKAEIDRLKKELGEAERSLFLWRDAKTDPPQLTGWYLVKLHGDREEDHAIIRVEEGFMEYQTGEPTEPDEWQAWAEFPAWINPEALTSQRQ